MMIMGKIKIFIASQCCVIRRGLKDLLKSKGEYICIFSTPQDKMARISREVKMAEAEVLVLDLTFSTLARAAVLIRRMQKNHPKVKIIVLTQDQTDLGLLLRSSAAGYMSIFEIEQQLSAAINLVMQGSTFYSPQIVHKMVQLLTNNSAFCLSSQILLTDREFEVFSLRNENMSAKEISLQLEIKVSTVRTHLRNINRKLD